MSRDIRTSITSSSSSTTKNNAPRHRRLALCSCATVMMMMRYPATESLNVRRVALLLPPRRLIPTSTTITSTVLLHAKKTNPNGLPTPSTTTTTTTTFQRGESYSSRVFDVHPFDEDDFITKENFNVNSNDSRFQKTNASGDGTIVIIAYWVDECLKYFPIFLPFIAYVAYDPTAELFAAALDTLGRGNTNWVAVDGGAYQAKIIAPAINGVVVPAISILFANLIGTTIQTLRQRQLDICTCLNMEAGQLRILQSLLDVFPTTTTTTSSTNTTTPHPNANSAMICRRYLTQYTTRLIAESQPTMAVESLDYSLDTEMNGVLAELNRLSSSSSSSSSSTLPCSPILLGNAYSACSKLYEERAKRITALRSLFPPLHFVIVSTLAVSICVAFLLETKQDILVFLNAIQLRILWTMLVGTFTALALVCYDLGNPFRGSYQISKSVHQLYTIRMTLRASLQAQQRQNDEDQEQQDSLTENPAGTTNQPSTTTMVP